MMPERLPDDALDSIAVGRPTAVLFRDCQAEPRHAAAIVSAKHRKPFVATARCLFEYAANCAAIEKPISLAQAVWRAPRRLCLLFRRRDDRLCGKSSRLRRQLDAALGTTALDNETPGFRRHPGTESVRARTLDFAGLVGPFHLPVPA